MPGPRRPLGRWERPSAWTVAKWSALVLSPLLLMIWLGPGNWFTPALVALVLPLGVLRSKPLVVLGLYLAEMFLDRVLPIAMAAPTIQSFQAMAVAVVLGYLAANLRPRVSIGIALVSFFVEVVSVADSDPFRGFAKEFAFRNLAILLIVWLVGNTLRIWLQSRQARQAEAEAQAVQAERLRIAREVHDMVAHSIGVIAIQAGMGSRVIDTQPAEAGNALRAIEEASRDALAGLRRMIGALRRADGEPIVGQHGLGDLDDLVLRSAGAGVRVDVQWRSEQRPLPPDVDLSAFRIIQEAVTNVVRHAGTDRCEVALDQRDQELLINVTDNGRGGVPTPGYGLRGMRERVALLQGDFTAAPRAEGGFQVSARLPIPAGVR